MKKLLVVGGTGFIGFHVIKEAIKRKWQVTSISLNKPKKERFLKNVKYLQCNFVDYYSLSKKINSKFDYVLNAGGYGKHPDFNKTGEKLIKIHVTGLINLVKILPRKKLKKFIQIGSSAEYGNIKSPIKENMKCNPTTPYGIAKFTCSNFLQNIYNVDNFPSTILRLFQVYGPSQGKNRILPYVIDQCRKNKKFPTTKGEQYCDFCFIDDVVKAVFKVFLSKNTNGEIINIGSAKPIKIKNIIKLVCKQTGKGKPLFGKLPYRKGTNMNFYPSVSKAKKLINWYPKIKITEGLNILIKDSYL